VYVFVAFIFVIIFNIIMHLTYFIFGYFKFIKARELTSDEIRDIINSGISHHTTVAGKEGIMYKEMVKASKFLTAYSNHFRKCAFFFVNEYKEDASEKFNSNYKHKWNIIINNLTGEQIEKLRIRNYDKALMYMGDFEFLDINDVKYTELKKISISKFRYYLNIMLRSRPDEYVYKLLLAMVLAALVVSGFIVIIALIIF
jgi:hypothetical protein